MSQIYSNGAVLLLTAVLAGCSGSGSGTASGIAKKQVPGGSTINLKTQKSEGAANEIVAAAYDIAGGPGAIYAREFLDAALAMEPNHAPAIYLRALMDSTPLMEGAYVRALPLATSADPEGRYAEASQALLAQIPEGDLKSFLSRTGNQIATESEAQDFMSAFENSLIQSRQMLRRIENVPDFAVTFTQYTGASQNQIIQDCAVKRISDGLFLIKDCPWKKTHTTRISFADVKATRLGLAGYLTFAALFTTYHFDGAVALGREGRSLSSSLNNRALTSQEQAQLLRRQMRLLKLRDGQRLRDVLSHANELSQAIEEASRLQAQLCAQGPGRPNRPAFLVQSGFCVGPQDLETARNIAIGTRGPVNTTIYGSEWSRTEWGTPRRGRTIRMATVLNVVPFFQGQVMDLKNVLIPSEFDACGNETRFPDPTMSGVLPNGDFVEIMRLNNPDFLRPRCEKRTAIL